MPLIGYARVSTDDQITDSQMDALRVVGCAEIFEERASGSSRARPELARALARVHPGAFPEPPLGGHRGLDLYGGSFSLSDQSD